MNLLVSAVEALGSAIESLPHGLQMIKLVNCKITPRGTYEKQMLIFLFTSVLYHFHSHLCLDLDVVRWLSSCAEHEAEQEHAV